MGLRPHALLLTLSAMLCACAGATTSSSRPASAANESDNANGLVTARSANFIVTTELGTEHAAALLVSMERDRDAMTKALFPGCAVATAAAPLEVVVLRPGGLAERIGRSETSMVVRWVSPVAPRKPVVLTDWHPTATAATYREVLAHRLMGQCWLGVPAWVQEGVAQLLITMETSDGVMRLGGQSWSLSGTSGALSPDDLIQVEEMRELPARSFASPAHRASAWAAVAALLLNGDGGRRSLMGYLRAIVAGETESAAWTAHLEEAGIQARMDAFVGAPSHETASLRYQAAAPVRPAAPTRLTEAEEALFWASHLPWDAEGDHDRADAYLDVADGLGGSETERTVLRAAVMADAGDVTDAVALLAGALAANPRDDTLAFAHLGARLMVQPSRLESGARGFDSAELEDLGRHARTAHQHDLLARAWLFRMREPQAAVDAAQAATRADPSSARSWLTLAHVLMFAGQAELSTRAYERSAALTGHRRGPASDRAARRWLVGAYEARGQRWCEAVPENVTPPTTPQSRPPANSATTAASPRGSLSASVIRQVIRSGLPEISGCAEQAARIGADFAGRVTVHFIIGGEGAVTAGRIESSTSGSQALACCTLRAVSALQFPAPEGGGVVSVTYPFTFQ